MDSTTGSTETPPPTSPPESMEPAGPLPPEPTPPAPLSIADILASSELLEQKETADKATLDSIGMLTLDELRSRLVVWGRIGFPNAHGIHSVTITPPSVCSDGTTRSLDDYILFCSGKTLTEHVAVLQAKVASDIQVGFANLGGSIAIVVTKA